MEDKGLTLLDQVLQLDAAGNINGMVQAIRNRPLDLQELLGLLRTLLSQNRLRAAYVLAMLLSKTGLSDLSISVALSFGGLLFGNAVEEAKGMASLQTQVDALNSQQLGQLYLSMISPVMVRIVEQHLLEKPGENPTAMPGANPAMNRRIQYQLDKISQSCESRPVSEEEWWRLMEMCKATIPPYRSWFDLDAPIPKLTLEQLRQEGRERARLIRLPRPSADQPRQRRRVIVLMRDFYIARRIALGIENYGWQMTFRGTAGWDISPETLRALVEQCRQEDTELLVLHFDQILGPGQAQTMYDLLLALRQEKPLLKIVVFTCDVWALRKNMLPEEPDRTFKLLGRQFIGLFDAIWSSDSPSLSTWDTPLLKGKGLHLHVPHAGLGSLPEAPLSSTMLYIGSEVEHRYSRKFFLMTAERLGVSVEQKDHFFVPAKNLAPLELLIPEGQESLVSYAQHMQRLRDATCCLHFSRTSDLHCLINGMVTHRSFEVPLSGSLLVQEYAADMCRFFVPGEHYLEFNSVAELVAIARFIRERPEEAEEIRRAGNAFAREHYSDDALIGYLDKFLWP